MPEERPRSIRWFEALSLASLMLSVINVSLNSNESWVAPFIFVALVAGLVLTVSRGRKNWARWVLAALFGLGFASMIWDEQAVMTQAPPLLTFGTTLLQALGLILLFTPQSSVWFRNKESRAETCS
jgi:hypothetical protein